MVATVGFEPTEHSTGAFNRVQADSLKPLGHITVLKMGTIQPDNCLTGL